MLAAGGGSRFADSGGTSHKLLADFRGRPVVVWAVEHAAAAGLDETIVVTGAVDLRDVLGDAVTIVNNERWAEGQATSLATAIAYAEAARHDAIVVGLGDQPLVTPQAWAAVAREPGAGDGIVVATYDGRRRNPVRLPRSLWPLLPTTGDEGARRLMRDRPELVREVACAGIPADVDTVEDLTTWS